MRVILADDAALVRQGVARLLEDNGFEVVAELGDADQLLDSVSRLGPDLVVIDVRMPPTHTVEGLLGAIEVKRHHPTVGVMVLSQHLESRYAVQLLSGDAAGVGYLLKDRIAESSELIEGARRVVDGGSAIDPDVVAELVRNARGSDRLSRLAPRERSVLAAMAEGRSNRSIADRLHLAVKTVEGVTAAIFDKLDLQAKSDDNRRVLAVLAYLDHST